MRAWAQRSYRLDMLDVEIARLDPTAVLPRYATEGDAGADLVSRIDTVLEPGERTLVPTGVAIALPAGFAAFIQPRSGLALKHGVTVLNSPGLIDAGYRGELQVLLINHGDEPFAVRSGERIAQLVVQQVAHVNFVEVADLDPTERGAGGWGHTGSAAT